MKIGLQTISWGENLDIDLPFFKHLAALGFEGLEIFQPCSLLGDAATFDRLLQESGITLLALSGGTLKSRIEFAQQLSQKNQPIYLYVQDLGDEKQQDVHAAIRAGYAIAIHPFLHTNVDSIKKACEQRAQFLQDNPTISPHCIQILPDTAHSFLAKESIAEWLEHVQEGVVKSIHVKDWMPNYGISMTTFSRGFCELGKGVITDILPAGGLLEKAGVEWLVVEQDYSTTTALQSAQTSIEYLFSKAPELRKGKANLDAGQFAADRTKEIYVSRRPEVNEFAAKVMRASTQEVWQLYETISKEWLSLSRAKMATLWEVQSLIGKAVFQTSYQPRSDQKCTVREKVISLKSSYCGLSISDQQVHCFNLVDPEDKVAERQFADQAMIQELGVTHMVSIPIFNPWNPAQPELIINLFGSDSSFLAFVGHENLPSRYLPNDMAVLRRYTSLAIQHCWDERRDKLENLVTWTANFIKPKIGETTSIKLIEELTNLIKSEVQAQHAYTFIQTDSRDGTELQQVVPPRPQLDSISEIANPYPDIAKLAREAANKAFEGTLYNNAATRDRGDYPILASPIHDNKTPIGDPIGVMCCIGKTAGSKVDSFTTTDVITADTAIASAIPHYSLLTAAEKRTILTAKVAHEMQHPIKLIINCAKIMLWDQKNGKPTEEEFNAEAILEHCWLAMKAAHRGSSLNPTDWKIPCVRSHTLLFQDVINPAIKQIQPELIKEGLNVINTHIITSSDIRKLRPLYLDADLFKEIVYNLLSNAIKYRRQDSALRIRIYPEPTEDGTNLIFEDNGIGIPIGMEKRIFERGVRGQNAITNGIEGSGLGLAIVRDYLDLHNAKITLQNRINPTRFAIFLPKTLFDVPSQV